ncbi:hypothetical protein FQR65_LT03322 [Abscondita terminalis]|nr:hypothetical protein FQR65_LT03322 [Abscondita terminalis]
MKAVSTLVLLLITVEIVLSNEPMLTVKKVPLHIRQSWLALFDPLLYKCICETGVNPTLAFKSIINTEVSSNACLKCFFKCLQIKLNIIDAITGEFQEKEMLRQVEGLTPDIFKKCKERTNDVVDLCKKAFDMYMCVVHSLATSDMHHHYDEKPNKKPISPVHTIA